MLGIKLSKIDFIAIIIMLVILTILTILTGIDDIKKDKYIQNLEEKVNIFEQDYINFATEDSKLQMKGTINK